jgi:hypothetical protein
MGHPVHNVTISQPKRPRPRSCPEIERWPKVTDFEIKMTLKVTMQTVATEPLREEWAESPGGIPCRICVIGI